MLSSKYLVDLIPKLIIFLCIFGKTVYQVTNSMDSDQMQSQFATDPDPSFEQIPVWSCLTR